MTTSLTTKSPSFNEFVKNNQPKISLENILTNPNMNTQPDRFEKNTAQQPYMKLPQNKKKAAKAQKINSFLRSVAVCVVASYIISKFLSHGKKLPEKLPEMPQIKTKDPFESLWVKLDDVLGLEDLALPKELNETVDGVIKCIENPDAIIDGGGEGIKTILLYGPPGTGKTTFTKALAKKIQDCAFASLDVTNLGSKYVGETEKNVQAAINEICKQADENPAKKFFVFIDEIDSIMMIDDSSTKKYSNDILNEFKRCFSERLGKRKNIIAIGATNVPINPDTGITSDGKRLDKPMLDRFQKKIFVGLPTSEQLKSTILKHYYGKTRVCEELKNADSEKLKTLCETLAQKSHETSFRTLGSIFNDAAIEGDISKEVTFQNIFNTIVSKREELHFNVDDLKTLARKLNVTFDAAKLNINK